ncbi:hypothetical protein [Actinomadura rupiterrae]|uniref:hypothetical protein n=1 Tax=Actinomadura rupiterrae TaxID=559627 RepID=UPI0020A4D007|nr:hypothetical protein [Actinomadura rupiterrae]MCP2339040.1 hypothetical protein [Actinomadura rupiterrae]
MKIRRIAAVGTLAAATAATALLTASAAGASSQAYGWVAANGQLCVYQNAAYQVRGEGHANLPGVTFRLRKTGGTTVAVSPGAVTDFTGEGRTSLGTFLGAGQYQLCANNNSPGSVYVKQLLILSDNEFN